MKGWEGASHAKSSGRDIPGRGKSPYKCREEGKRSRWVGPVSKIGAGGWGEAGEGVWRRAGPWRLSRFLKGSLGSLLYPCGGWTPERMRAASVEGLLLHEDSPWTSPVLEV